MSKRLCIKVSPGVFLTRKGPKHEGVTENLQEVFLYTPHQKDLSYRNIELDLCWVKANGWPNARIIPVEVEITAI